VGDPALAGIEIVGHFVARGDWRHRSQQGTSGSE